VLTDADLRAYLLGQTTEASIERVEIRLLEDDDFSATVGSVEDDLFDDYTRGALSEGDLQRFLTRYGREHGRLLVARALSAKTARPGGVFSPAAPKYWTLVAAAAIMAAVGVTFGLKSRPAPHHPPVAAVVSPPAPATSATVALLLTLGTSRSAAPAPEAMLPASAATLQLRVRIDPADTFDRYAMALRSGDGTVIWHADALEASLEGGDRILIGNVPAASLTDASYELAVRGSAAGSRPEVLGFAAVTVRR
jgi:hypothetical protein